jgi:hypothetical protein
VRWSSLLIITGLHALLSCLVFFGMMSSALRPPDGPATPWQHAVLLAAFWVLFLPSLLLQGVGINLWVLSLLVVPVNSLIWVVIIQVVPVARAARRTLRGRRRAA